MLRVNDLSPQKSLYWRAKSKSEDYIEYKTSPNPRILCFEKEAELLIADGYDIFRVDKSNSGKTYTLTIHPGLTNLLEENGFWYKMILGKKFYLGSTSKTPWTFGLLEKGFYLRTLQDNLTDSVSQALDVLEKQKVYHLFVEDYRFIRWKETSFNSAFDEWFESI
jgi:hypothetical protein